MMCAIGDPVPIRLKPCPMCGISVTLERTTDTYDRLHGNRQWWGVRCRGTGNRGGSCALQLVPSAWPEAAADRWNMRGGVLEPEWRASPAWEARP